MRAAAFGSFFVFTVWTWSAVGGCSSETPAASDDAGGNGEGGAADAGGCEIKVAATGDDATCAPGATCKSIGKALAAAAAGCTVRVAAGTYAAGETFPLEVKDGVRLVGAGQGSTTIDATGGAANAKTFTVSCAGTSDAQRRAVVALSGNSAVLSLKIVGAAAADLADVLATGGDVEIGRLEITGGEDAVLVTGAGTKANVHDLVVDGVGRSGIKPAGASDVTVTSVSVAGAKNGFEPSCTSKSTFTKSQSFCNGNGVFVSGQAKTKVSESDFRNNRVGVASKGAETFMNLVSNKIHDNEYGIVSVQGPLEAGNKATPGSNTVAPNAKAGIYLDKVATDVIAFGNTWVPSVDGADASGRYTGDAKYAPPMCPKAPYGSLDVDPPGGCAGDEKVTPAATYQNVVLVDATCPPVGPAVTVGTLALSTN